MQAKKTGTCATCGEKIWVGQEVTWNRRKAGELHHESCFRPEGKEVVEDNWEVVEPEPVVVKPAIVAKPATKKEHKNFRKLLGVCQTKAEGYSLNVWLTGPAGSGKTHAAKQVAEELGLPFYYTGAILEPFSLLGFTDAQGKVVRTQFREAWEHGGVFLFDEVDGSGANALLAFNGALANHMCPFPDAVIPQHKDCIIIAAANTWGHGATLEYVGRNKLDDSTKSRFVFLDWPYDESFERTLTDNAAWVARVQKIRANVASKQIKVAITPRATIYGSALLAAGFSQADVEAMVLRQGMTKEQWESISL